MTSSGEGVDLDQPVALEERRSLPPLKRAPPSPGTPEPCITPLVPLPPLPPPPLHQPASGGCGEEDRRREGSALLSHGSSLRPPTSVLSLHENGVANADRKSWRQRFGVEDSEDNPIAEMRGDRPVLRPRGSSAKGSPSAALQTATRREEGTGGVSSLGSSLSGPAAEEKAQAPPPDAPLSASPSPPTENTSSNSTKEKGAPPSAPGLSRATEDAVRSVEKSEKTRQTCSSQRHHHQRDRPADRRATGAARCPRHTGPPTNVSLSLPVPQDAAEEAAVFRTQEVVYTQASTGRNGLTLDVAEAESTSAVRESQLDPSRQADAENDGRVCAPYQIDRETFDVPLTCPDDHLAGTDRYWCPGKPLRISFVTWNMAKKKPRMREVADCCVHPNAHIVVVGTQENGPYVGTNKRQRRWARDVATGCLKDAYTLVGEEHMWAIHIVVFARTRDVASYVSHVDRSHVSTGLLGGLGGNKGGAAVSLVLSMVPRRIRDPRAAEGVYNRFAKAELNKQPIHRSASSIPPTNPDGDDDARGCPSESRQCEAPLAAVYTSFEEWARAPLPPPAAGSASDPPSTWPPPLPRLSAHEAHRPPGPHLHAGGPPTPAVLAPRDMGSADSDGYSIAEVETPQRSERPAPEKGEYHGNGNGNDSDPSTRQQRRHQRQGPPASRERREDTSPSLPGNRRSSCRRRRRRRRGRAAKREEEDIPRTTERATPPSDFMTILCVTAHLAAHQGAIAKRNDDYRRIVRRLGVGSRGKHRTFFQDLFRDKRRTYPSSNDDGGKAGEEHANCRDAIKEGVTRKRGASGPRRRRKRRRQQQQQQRMDEGHGYGHDLDVSANAPVPATQQSLVPLGRTSNVDDEESTAPGRTPQGAKAETPSRGDTGRRPEMPSSSGSAAPSSVASSASSDGDGEGGAGGEDSEVDIATLQLPQLPQGGNRDPKRGNHRDATEEFDLTLFGGDLNYRINGTRRAIEYIVHHHKNIRSILMNNDQLTLQRAKGMAFQHFQEGALFFRPTYKYELSAGGGVTLDEYNFSHKSSRLPAYCDRILYKKRRGSAVNRVAIRLYTDVPNVRTSDHRPVVSIFDVETFASVEHK